MGVHTLALCFPKRSSEFVCVSDKGPKYFWHRGPISRMTVFPRTRDGSANGLGMIHVHCGLVVHYISNLNAAADLTEGSSSWPRDWGPLC